MAATDQMPDQTKLLPRGHPYMVRENARRSMRAAFCDGIMAFSGITGAIRGDAADLLVRRDLSGQIGQDWRVADIACGDLDGPDLQRLLVCSEVDLAPVGPGFRHWFGNGMRRRQGLTLPLRSTAKHIFAQKEAKAATELLRTQARTALDQYRAQIFPAYETAINDFLRRFGASFRLGEVQSVNMRSGSSASYCVVINQQNVNLTAETRPSFRNTLSAGDRNTLALAFFFASLEQDPNLAWTCPGLVESV